LREPAWEPLGTPASVRQREAGGYPVNHTYSRHAPEGDVLAPYYYQLLDQVPEGRGEAFRAIRQDEDEDAGSGATR
jgi:hypothetical protein